MHSSSPPTRKLAALVAGVALAVSACGGPGGSAPQAAAGPVELTVSLFGTFGYQETGLFAEYEKQNPGVTIKYDSTQSEDTYWPALQTRLASGKGTSDVQGIEVARIADVVTNQKDLWTDLRGTPASAEVGNYLAWKEKAATTKDGAVLGLGTDIGPMALCYRSDLLAKAGLPTDPATLAAQMPTWKDFLTVGEKYKAAALAGSAWTDSAGGLYNAIVSGEQKIYYDESGALVYAENPAVKQAFDTAAGAATTGLTAKLEQFVDPGWDAGFGSGTFATIACPSWMIGYIKGKAGDAGSGQVERHGPARRPGRELGRLLPRDPGGEPAPGAGRQADHLAHRPRAAGEAVPAGRQLPVHHRRHRAGCGHDRPVLRGRPDRQDLLEPPRRPRRCRSSAPTTAC